MPNIFHNSLSLGYPVGGGGSYPTDGLISRWTFEDSLNDVYGSNNLSSSGTIAYETGLIGKCINYSSGKTYTSAIKSYMIGGNSWSISVWWKMKTDAAAYTPIFYFVGSVNPPRFYLQGLDNNTDIWYEAMDGARTYWNQTVSNNAWHHHVITFSKPNLLWYLDNGAPHTLSFNVNMQDKNQILTFGGRADNGSYIAGGYQDNSYLYSKALSAAEVSQLYNGGAGI